MRANWSQGTGLSFDWVTFWKLNSYYSQRYQIIFSSLRGTARVSCPDWHHSICKALSA